MGTFNTDVYGINFDALTFRELQRVQDETGGAVATLCWPDKYSIVQVRRVTTWDGVDINTTTVTYYPYITAKQDECPPELAGIFSIYRYNSIYGTRLFAYYVTTSAKFLGVMLPDPEPLTLTPLAQPLNANIPVNTFTPISREVKTFVPLLYAGLTIPLETYLTDYFNVGFTKTLISDGDLQSLTYLQWQSFGNSANTCFKYPDPRTTHNSVTWDGVARSIEFPANSECPIEIFKGSGTNVVFYKKFTYKNRLMLAYYDYNDLAIANKTLLGIMFLN